MGRVQDPGALYTLTDAAEGLRVAHLVVGLDGFVDAGSAGRSAVDHLVSSLDHQLVAEFDVDALLDYRARRPRLHTAENIVQSVAWRTLRLELVTDLADRQFLLLRGPEPDRSWQAFTAAVVGLAARFGVETMIGLLALPAATPHTRPITFIGTATRRELLPENGIRFGPMEVPGSLTSVLEYAFGQAGRDAVTLIPQVPNYISSSEVPHATAALLERLGRVTELSLPYDALLRAAEKLDGLLANELEQSAENREMVTELERQYDQSLLKLASDENGEAMIPTGDELARQFESFLANRSDDDK